MGQEKFYTVPEVAELLRKTPNFIRAEIRRKRLGANMIGNEYLISEKDFGKYKERTHTLSDKRDLIEI